MLQARVDTSSHGHARTLRLHFRKHLGVMNASTDAVNEIRQRLVRSLDFCI
jgi:hypothetical protein